MRLLLSVFLFLLPLQSQTPLIDKQISCLTDAIYYEAGNQRLEGKEAVAWVVFNRSRKFDMDACSVINQRINHLKQFTFTKTRIKYPDQYRESFQVAQSMYWNLDDYKDITLGAIFFHAYYVHPKWHLKRTVRIQDHIFYK